MKKALKLVAEYKVNLQTLQLYMGLTKYDIEKREGLGDRVERKKVSGLKIPLKLRKVMHITYVYYIVIYMYIENTYITIIRT